MQLALAIGVAVLIWWFGTGIVLYLNGRPRDSHRTIMLWSSVVLVLALAGLRVSSMDASQAGALCAFTCGVLVWSWLEISYLLGWVTGPRKTPCPPGLSTARRFYLAVQTSLYHELAVVLSVGVIAVLTYGAPNRVALWTFCVLWLMRWSAKLNIFFGVSNLNEQWLPAHMRFLVSYFGKRSLNLFFPLSVTAATVVAVLLAIEASAAAPGSFESLGLSLVTAFLVLAIIEHWFLVLPIPDAVLWQWAGPSPVARRTQ